jgi:hypothetical protein
METQTSSPLQASLVSQENDGKMKYVSDSVGEVKVEITWQRAGELSKREGSDRVHVHSEVEK